MDIEKLNLVINPDTDTINALRFRLRDFNIAQGMSADGIGLGIFLYSEPDEIAAGIYGWLWGSCLEIDYLWVDASLRGQGLGRRLLESLEAAAIERGGQTSILDTFTFQAPGFYQKLGYETFGVISGFGRGHEKIFFRKHLG